MHGVRIRRLLLVSQKYHTIEIPQLNRDKASRKAALMFYWISIFDLRNKSKKSKGFVSLSEIWANIHSKAFKRVFGSGYKDTIDELIELRWIARTSSYKNSATSWDGDGYPKGVKITDEAFRSGFTSREIVLTAKEEVKIFGRRKRKFNADLDVQYATKQQKSVSMGEGYKEAIKHEVFRRIVEAGRDQEKLRNARKWELQAKVTTNAVTEQTWWITKCIGNRIHTPITSMPGMLRNYLELDGEELVELDIANSQPAVFGAVMRWMATATDPELENQMSVWDKLPQKDKTKMRKIVSDEEYRAKRFELSGQEVQEEEWEFVETKAWKSYKSRYTCKSHYEYNLKQRAVKIKEALKDTEGLSRYCRAVESGNFYESIAKEAEIPWPASKPEVKVAVLKAFFEKNNDREDGPAKEAIKRLYGVAYDVLREIKPESYAAAAISMQRKESSVMHTEAIRSVDPIYVHDAILVKKRRIKEAQRVLGEELRKQKVDCKVNLKAMDRKYETENPPKVSSNIRGSVSDFNYHMFHNRNLDNSHSYGKNDSGNNKEATEDATANKGSQRIEEKVPVTRKFKPNKHESKKPKSVDLASRNLASSDLASSDPASSELASRNLASRNLASSELASRNLASRNLASSELASRNLASSDLASTPLYVAKTNRTARSKSVSERYTSSVLTATDGRSITAARPPP
jgi:hypothetical protein